MSEQSVTMGLYETSNGRIITVVEVTETTVEFRSGWGEQRASFERRLASGEYRRLA